MVQVVGNRKRYYFEKITLYEQCSMISSLSNHLAIKETWLISPKKKSDSIKIHYLIFWKNKNLGQKNE